MDIEWLEKTLGGNIAGAILEAPEVIGRIVAEGLELINAYKELKKELNTAINLSKRINDKRLL
jgi:hypothetical protein